MVFNAAKSKHKIFCSIAKGGVLLLIPKNDEQSQSVAEFGPKRLFLPRKTFFTGWPQKASTPRQSPRSIISIKSL